MKVTTCLQYCIKGMGKPLFNFANTKDGKTLINIQKKMNFNRDDQIKETLIAFNSYFMVEAAIRLNRLPKNPQSVIKFMGSDEFDKLHQEIVSTVNEESYNMDKDEQRLKMIGASIKRKREESGYSQKLVAEHLGITEKTCSEYERGKTQPPLLKLIAIAELFQCGLDELLVGISPAPDDQAKHIASLLHGLKRADRHHIVKIVEKIVLIAKGKIKIDT